MQSRWFLILPLLALLTVAYLIPLAWLMLESVSDPTGYSLVHFQRVIGEQVFLNVGLRTIRISAIVAAICVVIAYPLGWQIAKLPRAWLAFAAAVVVVPLLSSAIVRSEAWFYLMAPNGPIAMAFRQLPGSPEVILLRTEVGVIVAMVHVLLPIALVPLIAAFIDLDKSIVLAARNLGAGQVQTWRTVILPMTAPAAAASGALTFLLALGFWVTPAIIGSQRTVTIAPLISEQASHVGDIGLAAALAVTLLVSTLLFVILFALVGRRVFAWIR